MKKTLIIGMVIVMFLASVGAVSAAPLVTNGGFETPIVNQPFYGWDYYQSGTSGLGWTVVWDGDPATYLYEGVTYNLPAIPYLELQTATAYGGSVQPAEGNQWAELDTDWDGPSGTIYHEPANVKISQDIVTQIGAQCHVSYVQRCRDLTDCQMKFDWTGAPSVVTTDSTTGWTQFDYDLEATQALTTISFTDIGTPNSYGSLIDNVKVDCTYTPPAIPEFPTMALPVALIVGLIGAVLFIKSTKEN